MGLIKEPKGIDFVIQSPPLTDQEKMEISDFIKTRKLQNKSKTPKTIVQKRKNQKSVKV